MKKKFNTILISLCMIFAGILLMAIVYPFGGRHAFSISGKGILTPDSVSDDDLPTWKLYELKKTPLEDITAIDIDTDFSNIIIEESDGFYLEYIITSAYGSPSYSIHKGALTFRPDSLRDVTTNGVQLINIGNISIGNSVLNLPNSLKDVETYVKLYVPSETNFHDIRLTSSSNDITWTPSATASKVKMHSTFGSVVAKHLTADSFDLNSSSGNITLKNTLAKNGEIHTEFGYISMENTSFTNDATLTCSSGDIRLSEYQGRNISLHSEFGKIDCRNFEADAITFYTSSNDVSFELGQFTTLTGKSEFGSVSVEAPVMEDNCAYDLKTEFGAVTINEQLYGNKIVLNNNKTPSIEIKCSSGDITIMTK